MIPSFVCLANQPDHSRWQFSTKGTQEGRPVYYHDSVLINFSFFSIHFSFSLSFRGTIFLWILSLHFHSSSSSISLTGWKTTEDLPVLEAIQLHLMCLPPSPSLVGVKGRTLCYIWVNRQYRRDALPWALSSERLRLLRQNLNNEWLVTTWKWYRCGYWLASCEGWM